MGRGRHLGGQGGEGNPMNDSEIATHGNPTWRDRSDFIIFADIAREGLPLRLEQLWARQVTLGRFEICCIPFFAYDIALGDEVETEARGGRRYVVRRVVKRSGRYTFRAWFGDSSSPHARDELIQELLAFGCELEWSSLNLLAIDAATDDLAQAVADKLDERERNGNLVYETGRSG